MPAAGRVRAGFFRTGTAGRVRDVAAGEAEGEAAGDVDVATPTWTGAPSLAGPQPDRAASASPITNITRVRIRHELRPRGTNEDGINMVPRTPGNIDHPQAWH
ncbi:hypothetical protein Adi01nite_54530 [Amorphoplanes digitatis]|nr:hypothetical protein Adi01nite_54530 [Actinoplanes digitatis]